MIPLKHILPLLEETQVCVEMDGNIRCLPKGELQKAFPETVVVSIQAKENQVVLHLRRIEAPAAEESAAWVKAYEAENGTAPSFF